MDEGCAEGMNVTYTDSWFWDIVMYLGVDGHTLLQGAGRWADCIRPLEELGVTSVPNADGVVQDLMDEMFRKTGEPTAVRTGSASN
ncbi:hypothetical protein SAMN05446927_3824 [Caballeronia arationis]|uniref:Uncharacterized protein n=1 Tax=Caballeronia arationis TaxID=1777142 RepID=A0A7Z7I791_9BURK|nr:hypothetical protein SAMN05446927_3824 [Caballeronia arationis]